MAEKNNAVCAICGQGYHKCLSCKSKMAATPWKTHCCCANHYKIYQILHGYTGGIYDDAEAKRMLNNVDLSDLNNLRQDKQSKIKRILGTVEESVAEIVAGSEVEPEVEVVNDTPVVEEISEPVANENTFKSEYTRSDFSMRRKRR